MNARIKATKSGNHPAVIAHRRKMDSISETMMPALEALNARLDRAIEKAQADDDREDEQPESEGEEQSQEVAKP